MKQSSILLLAVMLLSCNKFLDKKNDEAFLIPEELKELTLLLQNNEQVNLNTTPDLLSNSDDIRYDSLRFSTIGGYNPVRHSYLWKLKDYADYNFSVAESWSRPYNAIYYANLCIDKVNMVEKTAANKRVWDMVYGSGLFLRAYHTSYLLFAFARNYDEANDTDPGIVLKLENDFNIPSVRSSVKDSYAQVLKDAKGSLDHLEISSATPFLPNKKAAYGLLARVYLSMLKYDSAFRYADLYLKAQQALTDFNNPDEVNINSLQSVKQFSKEISFVSTMANSVLGFPFAAADTSLYNSYEDNDLRKKAYFARGYNGQNFYNVINSSAYVQHSTFTGITTAEMFLTRAECYARSNKSGEALADLNAVLAKRYKTGTFIPVTTTVQQELFEKVLLERRKELVGRGLRWMDVKRLNKEFSNITIRHYDFSEKKMYSLPPNDDKYAHPIPLDIIRMTGMPQN